MNIRPQEVTTNGERSVQYKGSDGKMHDVSAKLPQDAVIPVAHRTVIAAGETITLAQAHTIEGFDFNKVFQESLILLKNPCITLNEADLALAENYFTLAREVVLSDKENKKEMLGSLVTSFTYMVMDVCTRALNEARKAQTPSSARVNLLFERFIALVTEYHNTERGVAFYADKLCLTPKYLSKLVKQASGRSAPAWIDSFVILEAKNMLKYSDKAIKEIVYALHFPNQSVFYKFFKAHTGMTPSEYRKG